MDMFEVVTVNKVQGSRRINMHERLRPQPCDVPPKQTDRSPHKQRRPKCGALLHLGPHHPEPAHIREYPHRDVPVCHAAIRLEMRELRIGVQLHSLNHCACLEGVRLERFARDVRSRGV